MPDLKATRENQLKPVGWSRAGNLNAKAGVHAQRHGQCGSVGNQMPLILDGLVNLEVSP